MEPKVTTQQLIEKYEEFSTLFTKFRTQECEVKNLKDLNYLVEQFNLLEAHVNIARLKTGVLASVARRMGKILMVVSTKDVGITNGWESHINYTWRADSQVGQKRVRADVIKSHCSAYLYTPETDTVENVTEMFKSTEEFIEFDKVMDS